MWFWCRTRCIVKISSIVVKSIVILVSICGLLTSRLSLLLTVLWILFVSDLHKLFTVIRWPVNKVSIYVTVHYSPRNIMMTLQVIIPPSISRSIGISSPKHIVVVRVPVLPTIVSWSSRKVALSSVVRSLLDTSRQDGVSHILGLRWAA